MRVSEWIGFGAYNIVVPAKAGMTGSRKVFRLIPEKIGFVPQIFFDVVDSKHVFIPKKRCRNEIAGADHVPRASMHL